MEALEPQDAETEDFEEENSADPNLYDLPVVTIFGGGIAGLSTAHELIERGFDVQLVEAVESKFGEYDCDVGGLAANQYSRVPASTKELHGPLLKGSLCVWCVWQCSQCKWQETPIRHHQKKQIPPESYTAHHTLDPPPIGTHREHRNLDSTPLARAAPADSCSPNFDTSH